MRFLLINCLTIAAIFSGCITTDISEENSNYSYLKDGSVVLWDGRVVSPMPELLSLREQYEVRNQWLRQKHGQLLDMMRKYEIGMWIIPEGTFDRDPLTHYVAPTRAFSHGVTHVFVDGGDAGLKRYSTYVHPNIDYTEFFESVRYVGSSN